MTTLDIVSLGEPMYEFSQIPGDAQRWLQGFGGDTMNAAIAAARLGARVAYVTRLGDDEFGRQFLELWRREGVDTSGVAIDPEAHTGVYFITHGADGHRFSYLRQGSAASRMRPEWLPRDVVRRGRYFHTSAISQAISPTACDSVFAAIEVVRAAGGIVAYDGNLRLRLWSLQRARAVIAATLALADIALLSVEEAQQLSGARHAGDVLEWCHRQGAKCVALKLGPEGVIGSDGRRQEQFPGHRVQAVDATGAGDCFAGAMLARMAAGDDFWSSLRFANAAAALTTTGYGAVEPLPRPADVARLLSEQ